MGGLLTHNVFFKKFFTGAVLPAFFLLGTLSTAEGQVPGWQDWSSTRKQMLEQRQAASQEEKLIMQELLQLRMKMDKLTQQLNELQERMDQNKKKITITSEQIGATASELKTRRQFLNRWLRSYYVKGTLSYLGVITGAQSYGDFIARFRLVQRLMDYGIALINQTASLDRQLRQQQEQLMVQKNQLAKTYEEVRQKNELLVKSKAEREKALQAAKQLSLETYQRLLLLEREWAKIFPQLDYILRTFPNLPWHKIEPDKLTFNLLQATASFEIAEENLNRQLTAVDSRLQDLKFELNSDSFSVTQKSQRDLGFKIWGRLKPEGSRIVYLPQGLEVAGTPVQHEVFQILQQDYSLTFSLGRQWQGLRVQSIEIMPGRVKFTVALNPND